MTRGSSLNTCLNISKIMSFNLLLTFITLYIYTASSTKKFLKDWAVRFFLNLPNNYKCFSFVTTCPFPH